MTIESNNEWQLKDNRFVAFLDILGFKEMIKHEKSESIYEMFNRLRYYQDEIDKLQKTSVFTETYFNTNIHILNFSDSIIIFSKSNTTDDFRFFNDVVSSYFGIAIKNKVPIKGAISYGEIYFDKVKQIYFGQPIIDAFYLEENLKYYGIVCHNSIEKYIYESNIKDNPDRFHLKEILTPFKFGNINHLNLIWFDIIYLDNENITYKEKSIKLINNFKKNSSGEPRIYIDNTLDVIEQYFKDYGIMEMKF